MPLPACCIAMGAMWRSAWRPGPKTQPQRRAAAWNTMGTRAAGIGHFASPGGGGGGRRSPAYRPVPRGRIMVAIPMLRVVVAAASVFPWHPRAYARHRGAGRHCGRRSPGKRNLCQHAWDAQPPARPPPGPPRVPRGRGMRVGLARTGHRGVSRLARHRYGPHGPAGRM
jgi:hypothetical protein